MSPRLYLGLRLILAAVALTICVNAAHAQPDSTNGWGYPLDSLQLDLARWRQHPLMRVDSIGLSVQGRPLWRINVGEQSGVIKPRIFVHARTHPAEVQAFYVMREMLAFVTDTTLTNIAAANLRRDFIFHFVPMYNPDGVALGKARQNANNVDIESNWNKTVLEPEVAALKATFQSLSTGPANGTIRVALNLHSDQVNCTRFFFYHDAAGTSTAYANLEKEYITGVRSYFVEGIQPWNYVVSWTGGFASQYPESFWWLTRGAEVMALTYEDTNCPGAGDFARTGQALALGTGDYLRNHPVSLASRMKSVRQENQVEILRGPTGGSVLMRVTRRDGKIEFRDARGKVMRVEP
jgi:hypothetical protein